MCFVREVFLIFVNVLVVITGAVIIGLSSYTIHTLNLIHEVSEGGPTEPFWALAVGIVLVIVAMFGICGIVSNNSTLIYIYGSLMILCFLGQLSLCVLFFVYNGDEISEAASVVDISYNIKEWPPIKVSFHDLEDQLDDEMTALGIISVGAMLLEIICISFAFCVASNPRNSGPRYRHH